MVNVWLLPDSGSPTHFHRVKKLQQPGVVPRVTNFERCFLFRFADDDTPIEHPIYYRKLSSDQPMLPDVICPRIDPPELPLACSFPWNYESLQLIEMEKLKLHIGIIYLHWNGTIDL